MPPYQEMSAKRALRSARGEALRQAYIDDGGWEKVDGWLYLKALRLTDYIDKLQDHFGVFGNICEIGLYFGKYFIIDETGSTLIFDSLEHWNQSKDRSKEFSKKWIDSLGNKYDLVERQDVTEEWTPTEDFKRVWKTISLGDSRQFTDISVETNSVQKMSGFKVCDEGGSISAGDLLCTSSKTGRLMKQPDDLMHSYTVAKAMEDVTFDADGNADGVYGYVYCG